MPSTLTFRSDVKVEYLRHAGDDRDIACAAWVLEPGGSHESDTVVGRERVIRAMMKGRHGTPFEHGSLTVHVEAPIFVFREWHRHRVGWSYNETSARYRPLDPVFWVPAESRPLAEPVGFKPLRPRLAAGSPEQRSDTLTGLTAAYSRAWDVYEALLGARVAREVARAVLPVGIYSSMHATCNPRSLMHFLSLRTHDESATFPSYPQAEIEDAARQLEGLLARFWPVTYRAFVENGRVAP